MAGQYGYGRDGKPIIRTSADSRNGVDGGQWNALNEFYATDDPNADPNEIIQDPATGQMRTRREVYADPTRGGGGYQGYAEGASRILNADRAAEDAKKAQQQAAVEALGKNMASISYDVTTKNRELPNVASVNKQTAAGPGVASGGGRPSYQQKMDGMSGARRK